MSFSRSSALRNPRAYALTMLIACAPLGHSTTARAEDVISVNLNQAKVFQLPDRGLLR